MLYTPLRWYDRQKWRPSYAWGVSALSAADASISVQILKYGPTCICGAGCGLCSCTLFPLLTCACGVKVLPAAWGVATRRCGATGRGRGHCGGASLPGRVTSSGRKFPVARALCRLSKFDYVKDRTIFMRPCLHIKSRWGCKSRLLVVVWVEEVGWRSS